MWQIGLCSSSKQRQMLLEGLGAQCRVLPPDFDESSVQHPDPITHVKWLARGKLHKAWERYPQACNTFVQKAGSCLLAADTLVFLGTQTFGKPQHARQARVQLDQLAGQTHQVITAFAVQSARGVWLEAVVTHVRLRQLSDAEKQSYSEDSEGWDKSGGYAIQGRGGLLIDTVSGSYTNVIGLPLGEVSLALHQLVA